MKHFLTDEVLLKSVMFFNSQCTDRPDVSRNQLSVHTPTTCESSVLLSCVCVAIHTLTELRSNQELSVFPDLSSLGVEIINKSINFNL